MVAHVKFSQLERGECWRIKKMEFWAMRTVACVVSSVEPSFLITSKLSSLRSNFAHRSRSWELFPVSKPSPVQYAMLQGCGCQCVVQRGVTPRSSYFIVPSPWPVTMCLRPQCSVLMKHFSRFNIMIDRPTWQGQHLQLPNHNRNPKDIYNTTSITRKFF